VVALCLAGCGGGSHERVAPLPKLPAPVAFSLASRSDEVARALDAGDSCHALAAAKQLREETIAAINARRIPGPFQETLGNSVNDLVARITCVPPPEKPKDHGKHKGHDKKHGEND
jgi:hypothetical protein